MLKWIVAVLVGIVLVGAAALAVVINFRARLPIVTQPIAFSHQIHVTKANLQCASVCHAAAQSEVFAGLPSKDVCFECHDPDEETPDYPELTKLASYVEEEGDIPWNRVAVTAPDVFFSHRRHVTCGQIECESCHLDVAEATGPLTQVSRVLYMKACLECHEHEGADVDCLACHR